MGISCGVTAHTRRGGSLEIGETRVFPLTDGLPASGVAKKISARGKMVAYPNNYFHITVPGSLCVAQASGIISIIWCQSQDCKLLDVELY